MALAPEGLASVVNCSRRLAVASLGRRGFFSTRAPRIRKGVQGRRSIAGAALESNALDRRRDSPTLMHRACGDRAEFCASIQSTYTC